MKKNSNIILVVAFIILLIIVILTFKDISGNVISFGEFSASVEPGVVKFDRFDSEHVARLGINTGQSTVESRYQLKSLEDGQVYDEGYLCAEEYCRGAINHNVIISREIPSGQFYVELNTDNGPFQVPFGIEHG